MNTNTNGECKQDHASTDDDCKHENASEQTPQVRDMRVVGLSPSSSSLLVSPVVVQQEW
jgi:hypothetical protein